MVRETKEPKDRELRFIGLSFCEVQKTYLASAEDDAPPSCVMWFWSFKQQKM